MQTLRTLFAYVLVALSTFWFPRTEGSEEELDFELDPYVVTATRTLQPYRTAPGSVSLVSKESLDLTPSPDLLSALQNLAGFNLQGRGLGARKVFTLRGMESRHSLILVDGRRISATDETVGHSDFQYSWVPVSAIERIEVVRGPMSALYGSEAMGGVINIITRAVPVKWEGEVSGLAGSREDGRGGDEQVLSANFAGPLGETLGLRLSALYHFLDDTPFEDQPELSELEGTESTGVNSLLTWRASENHRVEFSFDSLDDRRFRFTQGRRPPIYKGTYMIDQQQIGLRWLPQFARWSGQLGAYESKTDVVNSRTNGVTPATPQFLRDRVVDFDFNRNMGENHTFTYGGELREEQLTHRAFNAGVGSADHNSIFLQDQWQATKAVGLTGAIRYDSHSFFDAEMSPRLYMVWSASEQVVLKAGYGHGFKAPTLKQVSPEYRFDGPHSFLGNEDVRPESSDSWEMSVDWQPNETFGWRSTFFNTEIQDLIDLKCIDNCGARLRRVYEYFNLESAEMLGLETEIIWDHVDKLGLRLNHTWLETEDKTSGLPLPERPKHQFNFSIRRDLVEDHFSLFLSGEFVGKQYYEDEELPAFNLFHANLRWEISDSLTAVLSARNLGDTDLLTKSDLFGYALRGRSYSARIKYQF